MRPFSRREPVDEMVYRGVAYYCNGSARRAMRQAERISKKWSPIYRHKVRSHGQPEPRCGVFESKEFRKEVRDMRKRGLDRMSLEDVVARLAAGEHLPPEYDNHRLRNPLHMHRVCRINGDFYLVYSPYRKKLILRRIWTEGVVERERSPEVS